jgi:hypothetical protein
MVITLRQSVRASPTSYYPTSARSSGHWRTTTNPKTLLALGGEMCQASLLSALLVYVIATAPPHSLHCVPCDCLHQTFLNYKLLPFCNSFSCFPFLLQPHPTLPLPIAIKSSNQTQPTNINLPSTTSSTMDFVKDKVNQVSETIQGKGAEASAKQNKGELTINLFLMV